MSDRDRIIDMRQRANEGEKRGWPFLIDNKRMPIPAEVKSFFKEAIDKALDYYNSEIEKL